MLMFDCEHSVQLQEDYRQCQSQIVFEGSDRADHFLLAESPGLLTMRVFTSDQRQGFVGSWILFQGL